MDLVVGMDATTAYLQPDNKRLDQFSIFERFTLRLKDPSALVRLNFEKDETHEDETDDH